MFIKSGDYQMVFKKLFPKSNEDKLTTQAKLKTLTYKLDLKIKDYDNKARLCKAKAKQYLKAGNRTAAKNMLAREKQFQQKVSQYSAMIMKAERHMDALEQADTIKDVASTMESSAAELKAVSATVNVERAMEITEDAEESIDQINEAGELFAGDPELDLGIDIDDELAQLETELMLEDAGQLPETPIDTSPLSYSLEESETDPNLRSKDALKDEIDKLRKELDM